MKLKKNLMFRVIVCILLWLVFVLCWLCMGNKSIYEGVTSSQVENCTGTDTCAINSNCSEFIPIDKSNASDVSFCRSLNLTQSFIKDSDPDSNVAPISMWKDGTPQNFTYVNIDDLNLQEIVNESDVIDIDVDYNGTEIKMDDVLLSDGTLNECGGVQWIIPVGGENADDVYKNRCNMRININPDVKPAGTTKDPGTDAGTDPDTTDTQSSLPSVA